MKRIFILAISLMLIISLATGCDNSQVEAPIDSNEEVEEVVVIEVEAGKGIMINYAIEDEEDIFGGLSKEKINEILDGIFEKVSKNDKYKENTDLAIEEVFKEYGITDEDKLDAAKSKLNITRK